VIKDEHLNRFGIFNFSYGSDNYIDMYFKLKFLYDNNIDVDTVFITADDHTLSEYREIKNNSWRSLFYTDYNIYRKYYNLNFISFLTRKYILYYMPLFNTNNSKLLHKRLMDALRPNYQRSNEDWSKNKNKVKSCEQKMNRQFPSDKKSKHLKNCLCDIIKLCNENNTVLVGIKFPIARDYLNLISDKNYYADKIFKTKNVEIIDMKELFIRNDEYFRDADHLNDLGSDKFTLKLNELLILTRELN
jgi:hypothetical protein